MAHNDPKSTLTREAPQAPVDTANRARLLLVLGAAEEDALTIGDLRERGVRMPGQAIYELELDGYPVERVHRHSRARHCSAVGYRLGAPAAGARDHANMMTDA